MFKFPFHIIAIILLLGLTLLLWPQNKNRDKNIFWQEAESVTRELSLKVICKNDNNEVAKVHFRVPLLKDVPPYQRVNNLQVIPTPQRYEQDPYHNFYAIYELQVEPHKTFSVIQKAEVITQALISQFSAQSLGQDLQLQKENYVYSPPLNLGTQEEKLAKNLANELIEGQNFDLYKIWQTYDYIRSLNFKINEKSRTFREIVENKTLQCIDAALLQTKLLQVLDYRARIANGFIIDTSQYRLTTAHSWSEFYTPTLGFIPLDPTQGRFPNTRTMYFGRYDPNYITWYIGDTSYGCRISSDLNIASPPVEIKYKIKKYNLAPHNNVEEDSGFTIKPQIVPEKKDLTADEALQYIKDHPRSDDFLEEFKGISWNQKQLKTLIELKTPTAQLAYSYYLINSKKWQQADDLLAKQPSQVQFLKVQALLTYLTRQNLRANEFFSKLALSEMDEVTAEVYWQNWDDQHIWDKSLSASKAAAKLFPQNYLFKVQVFRAAFNTGNNKEIETAWHDLRQANPKDGYPYLIASQLHLERDDKEACLKAAQEALKLELPPDEKNFCEELVRNLTPPEEKL